MTKKRARQQTRSSSARAGERRNRKARGAIERTHFSRRSANRASLSNFAPSLTPAGRRAIENSIRLPLPLLLGFATN
jgi:hypothetical protein